jgi:hypothetical protein
VAKCVGDANILESPSGKKVMSLVPGQLL